MSHFSLALLVPKAPEKAEEKREPLQRNMEAMKTMTNC